MTIKGTLKRGLKIGDELHKDFEMRAACAGDMFDAEKTATVSTPLTYRSALMGIQLVRLGTLNGPIDVKVLRGLHPADLDILTQAQQDADNEGNEPPSS
jgi:phage FluMu protein gp41